jgi:short-subunit dehydrogenase involved in D-alanine esterification of teichoic acids
MMDIGDAKELKKLLAKIATEHPPINPLVSAHIDQICRHHRDHNESQQILRKLIAIAEQP